jgi:hypothetical protein
MKEGGDAISTDGDAISTDGDAIIDNVFATHSRASLLWASLLWPRRGRRAGVNPIRSVPNVAFVICDSVLLEKSPVFVLE